ncbi:MAG: hypothetical protein COV45_00105 [Deltaproteobacteria bacterium CG11_big_fil_rev_8_21_14_0_20_47_16]|nr:MAG: hypothetical protein COV45_00105 [Deltaproteobacteria bacterium CG11_big_fil_rev_8_21_14_0_20_47_16]
MTTFVYKARDRTGGLISGTLEGPSVTVVKEALASQGLFPVSVQPRGFDMSIQQLLQRKIKTRDIVNLTRQFEVMFAAGSPMDRILATLTRQTKHEGLKDALSKIHKDVSSGMRLSDAFAKHPKYFGHLYTSMLAVGEIGGVLDRTLKGMTGILGKEDRIKSKVKSATLYPKIVIFALVVVATLMLIFVIPVFNDFYAGYSAKLPVPTRILIFASNVVVGYWWLAAIVTGALIWGWKKFKRTNRGKEFTSYLEFHFPVFGKLNLLAANARFGHLLGALYKSGLPLSRSLEVVADTIDNLRYARDVKHLKEELDKGRSLSVAMEEAKYFTPLMKEVTGVGEQTGKLDEMLETTAIYYDEEVDDMLKNLTTLLEPLLLFGIFGMVGLLALAVYMPVWNLSNIVNHQ